MEMQQEDIVEVIKGNKEYKIEEISNELYTIPVINDTVNLFAGKIIEDLFTFFGVNSELPFDRVAARIYDGQITIGSVLAKIKQLKDENDVKKTDDPIVPEKEKTEDEIIDDVMNAVKKKKETTDARATTGQTDGVPPAKQVENAPEPRNGNEDGDALKALDAVMDAKLKKYAISTRETIAQIIDKADREQFLENYNHFVMGKGKDAITEFNGNKESVIASIGYMVCKELVGEKNMPLGTKKAFYDKIGIAASSCRRAEKKVGEFF